jgi:multiple sugar transport system substrate-binding protein
MSFSNLYAKVARFGLTWAAICLAVISLPGCGEQASPTPEPVTIRFAAFDVDPDYFRAAVQEFNESYPHITVELSGSGDEEADVFLASVFALSDLREEEAILSLGPFIEQDASFDLSDFYPGTVALLSSEGQVWAIPAGANMRVLYYNQDLFDQYGVPYPEPGWTWDDFLDKALALRDPGASVFGYAPIDPFLDALSFVYQHGGWILDDLTNPTRPTLDDPLTVEALEWYASLTHEHNVAPTRDQLYNREFGSTMQSGVYLNKVGMWLGWLSERGGGGGPEADWPGPWKMRWEMVPLPSDARTATLAFAAGYFISSQTQYRDACWQWISFLSQQMPQDAVPARRSLAESATYEQIVGSDVAAIARASLEDADLLSPELVEFGYVMGAFGRALDRIINGGATPEEAMAQAQREAGGANP